MNDPWKRLTDQSPSPLQAYPLLSSAGKEVRFWVKRDDLLRLSTPGGDLSFCGNKWRKLKYNLLAAREARSPGLLTFGGAYSNHLAATAAAGELFGFSTVGIVRGEAPASPNPTLQRLQQAGMKLYFVSRGAYRRGLHDPEVRAIVGRHPGYYLLPEGGTNRLALLGCRELAVEITDQLSRPPERVAVSMGTGGTAAGLITAGPEVVGKVCLFPALKGDWMAEALDRLLDGQPAPRSPWEVIGGYSFGGFVRFDEQLIEFMRTIDRETGLALDPVYTAKLFWGVHEEYRRNRWQGPLDVVIIHSGGLQGRAGFEERFGLSLA